MIKSMTGYGRYEIEENNRKITVEMSSVNHRYCDINMRMPRTLMQFEDKVRKLIKERVARGKMELNIYCMSVSEDDVEVIVNEGVCNVYVEALKQLGETYGLVQNLGTADLLKMNDVISLQKKQGDLESIWTSLEKAVTYALDELCQMRAQEGLALKSDLLEKADGIDEIVSHIAGLSSRVVEEYRTKLEERLALLLDKVPVDENRIATEIALFADRAAIDEELTRLASHTAQLRSILNEGGNVGRKLDFLMQEMNREANTIASKSSDVEITNDAVVLKTEIEKIREQIQNIE
ncbi:MAG: YicC/YloC family endoribonuclease [Cellulosilyticaceae bacterium]